MPEVDDCVRKNYISVVLWTTEIQDYISRFITHTTVISSRFIS